MTNKNKKGFTLIELLVVIAIITLLSSVILAALTTARGKAQDARRKMDAKTLRNALALYRESNSGQYFSSTAGEASTVLSVPAFAGILPTVPRDPKWTGINNYRYISNGTSYGMRILFADGVTYCRIIEPPNPASSWWGPGVGGTPPATPDCPF